MIFYFSVSPQYLFSEFTKDLIAARKEFCEACDVESDSEEKIHLSHHLHERINLKLWKGTKGIVLYLQEQAISY